MSSSLNGIKSGLAIALTKQNKSNEDQLEMNSINSTILLNPSAIKNNHPVINQLYAPVISQRPDAIDLTSISIPTFPNNINQLLLATHSLQPFQPFQPNKYHVRGNTGASCKIRMNDFNKTNLNSQQQSVINFTSSVSNSTSTGTSSNSAYMSNNMRLTNELSPSISQMNKSSSSPSNLEINAMSSSNKQSNQLKRTRLNSRVKSFIYSDKSAVDSVKKLDKIILNHNKNLQEIIKHKNQLIKTITAKQTKQGNSDHVKQSSQFNLNNFNNINQINFQNSHLNNFNHFNNHVQPNIHQLNHQINHRMNHINLSNQLNSNFNNTNNKSNKYQPIKYQFNHLNQTNKQINVNKRLCWKNDSTIDLLNNSLNALTKAINEEAELNRQIANQKRLMSQEIVSTKINEKNSNKLTGSNKKSPFNLVVNNDSSVQSEFSSTSFNDSFDISNSLNTFNKQSNIEFNEQMNKSSYLTNESSGKLYSLIDSSKATSDSSTSQPCQTIISKLDERESRKKKLNNDLFMSQVFYYDDNGDIYELDVNEYSGDEISDCENEDEYDYRLKAHSIIFKTSRSSPNLTNDKIQFLGTIDLITDEQKRRLEFDKLLKSKRTLKEINNTTNSSNKQTVTKRKRTLRKQSSDLSSVNQNIETVNSVENALICNLVKNNKKLKLLPLGDSMEIFNKFVEKISTRKIEFDHLEPSKVQPCEVRDPFNQAKQCFMSQIDLELECDVENIKKRELNWEGCLEDRERRKIFDTCLEKLTDNLEPLTKQSWLINLNERTLNGVNCEKLMNLIQPTKINSRKLNYNLNQIHGNLPTRTYKKDKKFSQLVENVDLSGLKECFQVTNNFDKSSVYSCETFFEKVNKSNLLSQSFSESLQIKNVDTNLSLSKNSLVDDQVLESIMDKQIESFNLYKWPGIQTVIQSYHDYSKYMQNEKVIWSKRNHTACKSEQEFMELKDSLKLKHESLIKDLKDVNNDSQQISLAIESLVSWFKNVK